MSSSTARATRLLLVAFAASLASGFSFHTAPQLIRLHAATRCRRDTSWRRTGDDTVIMSRRTRRKRGAAAGQRARNIDIVNPDGSVAYSELSNQLSHREASRASGVPLPPQPFPYLCVFDVEATCDEKSGFNNYHHEIIEFPVVVIDLHNNGEVFAEFHSYVKPTVNTTLTDIKYAATLEFPQLSAATDTRMLTLFAVWRATS